MNFIDSINEGVLFSSQLKTTLSQLNSKLEAAKSKILFEINQNWINLNIVHSETLISILHKVIEDNYDLTLEIDNSMDNTLGAFLKKKIYLNLYEIIQDVKIFKILRITGKLTFIDDLFTRIVTTISHELTHYAQEMTRSKKIMERILQKYETQGSKYYDNL